MFPLFSGLPLGSNYRSYRKKKKLSEFCNTNEGGIIFLSTLFPPLIRTSHIQTMNLSFHYVKVSGFTSSEESLLTTSQLSENYYVFSFIGIWGKAESCDKSAVERLKNGNAFLTVPWQIQEQYQEQNSCILYSATVLEFIWFNVAIAI